MKNQLQKEAQRLIEVFGDKASLVIEEIKRSINEDSDYLNSLNKNINEIISNTKVEYIYNFIDGGWNIEWATSEKEAIKQAKKRWKGSNNLIVDVKSFRKATKAEEVLLNNFW